MNSVNVSQLISYREQINTGGVDAARAVYADLHGQGYNYAGWALGVATGNTITGNSALNFMGSTALMGMGGEACRNLSSSEIDAIRVDMARGYINNLIEIAERSPDLTLNRDVNFQETSAFHRDAFESHGLSLENWTLNTPMELIRQQKGDQAVEALWVRIRDTAGDYADALAASTALAAMVGRFLYSTDANVRNAAAEWMENAPGMANFDQLGRLLRVLEKTLENWLEPWLVDIYPEGESLFDYLGDSVGDSVNDGNL